MSELNNDSSSMEYPGEVCTCKKTTKKRYKKCVDEMEFRAKESSYKFFFTRMHLFDIWREKEGVYADKTRHVFEVLKGALPNVENMNMDNLYKRVAYVCNKLREFWKKKHSRAKMISSYHDWLNVMEECELTVAKRRSTRSMERRSLRIRDQGPRKHVDVSKKSQRRRMDTSKKKAMAEADKELEPEVPSQEDIECRACLQKFGNEAGLLDIFQPWEPPWDGMGDSIAMDLAQIANVDITSADAFPKMICQYCHQKLLEACSFVVNVRINDRLLRQRVETLHEHDNTWPKPIQVTMNINSDIFNTPMDVEIKQEVVSDDEIYPNGADESFKEGVEGTEQIDTYSNLEIKIEPEEIMQAPPIQITVNGTITQDQFEKNILLTNGDHKSPVPESEFQKAEIKSEPKSEEDEVEQPPDLPLECMLCTKSFNSVTGLKAHVIAQHSYKTVKRKLEGESSPEKTNSDKHVCVTCRRSFTTSTDLMVHETCHNKLVCYGCNHKCDTFEQLTKHRKKCKALKNNPPKRPKTLDDVKRPHPETSLLVEAYSQPADISNSNVINESNDMHLKIHSIHEQMDVDQIDNVNDTVIQ